MLAGGFSPKGRLGGDTEWRFGEIDCFDCQTVKVWLIAMLDVIDELRSWLFGVERTDGLGVLQDLPLPKVRQWGQWQLSRKKPHSKRALQPKCLGCAQTLSIGKREVPCSSPSRFLPECLMMFKSDRKSRIGTL